MSLVCIGLIIAAFVTFSHFFNIFAMTQRKDRAATKNTGVRTDFTAHIDIQDELRHVIDLMGPETPNFHQDETSIEDFQDTSSSMIQIDCDEKELISHLVLDPSAKPISANTPRDYSELSSLVTDTVAVYIDPNVQNDNFYQAETERKKSEINIKIRNPMQRLSSLFMRNSPNGIISNYPQSPPEAQSTNAMNQNLDLYRINILQPKSEAAPKVLQKQSMMKCLCFIEDPMRCTSTVATNTTPRSRRKRRDAQLLYRNANCNDGPEYQPVVAQASCANSMQHGGNDPFINVKNKMQKKTIYQRTTNSEKIPGQLDSVTRVDVYYFDHGNSAYYHTTDCPPVIMTEILAQKTENYTTKFWAETFGFIHILFSFITSFILQLLRSFLQSFIRPLIVGILQILSDYCIKPLLATVFNALVQPPLIFIYNVATTFRDICDPVAEGIGFFLREGTNVLSSIRLVDIQYCAPDGKNRRKSTQPINMNGPDLEHN